jgi:peptidoglycan/xylan/chitin deacetylase (PgdA/CDA1 family)
VSRTHYPGFIFGLPLRRDEIPVFTYHDVQPASFARDLEFLRDNGYRTLGLDEYLGARVGKPRREKCVLLTFDDARKSFAEVAMPLLRTFEARAVLFAPSYWMAASQPDCIGGRGSPDDLFMSWEQLRVCVESGLVDVQSHAHRHALISISRRLVDFATPQTLARFDIYDWPMRWIRGADEVGRPRLGTPIYRAAPLLSASQRYLESDELTQACRIYVERSGGEDFFLCPDWRVRLLAFHRERLNRMPGRWAQPAEFSRLLESEFECSCEAFRMHLGYTPHCIAYPWMLGSTTSLQLGRCYGLRAAFGVALDFGAERRGGLPLPVFGRLKCDWLRFLPGERRCSVFVTLGRKLTDLASVQHLAH